MFWTCCACFIVIYIFLRLSVGITHSSTCLVGKTAIVTGANSGLGYYTALNLASRGCRVIMADVADMDSSKNNIIQFTRNKNIVTKKLDLSSLKSVREFAFDIIHNESKLDLLINNAGIAFSKENRTEDGLHPVMQVNYFGHFLLTHLLTDLLKKSAPSRIIFTSSFMAFFHHFSIDTLNYDDTSNNSFKKLLIYNNSKYAVLIASDMFARKLEGSGVTSNSVNPGIMKTNMPFDFISSVQFPVILAFLGGLFIRIYGKSAWEGAQALSHVAVSSKLEGTTGKYFWDCKPFPKPFGTYNGKFCTEIWAATEKYVKLAPDERF